jgi:hypothetical protein
MGVPRGRCAAVYPAAVQVRLVRRTLGAASVSVVVTSMEISNDEGLVREKTSTNYHLVI